MSHIVFSYVKRNKKFEEEEEVFPVNEVLYTFIYIVLCYAPVVKSHIAFLMTRNYLHNSFYLGWVTRYL